MIGTPHMLTGALVASRARTPGAALALGITSHLALDTIPHTDYPVLALFGAAAASDLVGGAMLTRAIVGADPLLLAGAFGGVLPDFLAFAERAARVRVTRSVHMAIHTNVEPPVWAGVATQVATGAAALLALRACVARRRRRVQPETAARPAPPRRAPQLEVLPGVRRAVADDWDQPGRRAA